MTAPAIPQSSTSLQRRLMPLYIAVFLQGFLLWVPVEKLFMSEIGFDPASIGLMAAAYAAVVPIIEVPHAVRARYQGQQRHDGPAMARHNSHRIRDGSARQICRAPTVDDPKLRADLLDHSQPVRGRRRLPCIAAATEHDIRRQ
jgi:hypothetical protein